MESQVVITARSEGVTTLTLNRPEVLNAMNGALLECLLQATEQAVADPGCRVIVLTGAGRAFCAGGDLASGLEGVNGEGTLEQQAGRLRHFMRVTELLYYSEKITVAAINGACAGAGLSIACACDFRISTDSAKFNTAFQNAGVPGDFGISWLLPRLVGLSHARRMMLDPQKLSAQQLEVAGLIDEICPAEGLAEAVGSFIERLLLKAPLSLAHAKLNLSEAFDRVLSRHMDIEARRHAECCRSADAREAATAFLEKRRPDFIGR